MVLLNLDTNMPKHLEMRASWYPTCNAYLAKKFETNVVQNFPMGMEAAVITTVLDLTEKVSAGSGGRRAAASHHKLGARLPAYEGVVSWPWATRLSAKEASEFRPISARATRDSPRRCAAECHRPRAAPHD